MLEAGRFADAQWLPGDPERVIPAVLKYEDVDLLVMGAFGDPKVRRFIHGSTTATLLQAAEIPVLVFRVTETARNRRLADRRVTVKLDKKAKE